MRIELYCGGIISCPGNSTTQFVDLCYGDSKKIAFKVRSLVNSVENVESV
jgi:hypothetical protein